MTIKTISVEFARAAILNAGRAGKCDIYTDGGCEPNPGHGGWGVVIILPFGAMIELYGGAAETTNNRMEMVAVLQAMRCLPDGWGARIHSDSQYVVDGLSSWVPHWKKNGWRRRPGRNKGADGEIKNLDIWQALDTAPGRMRCHMRWVRGHAGNEHNERADQLATLGRQEFLDGKVPAVEISAAVAAPPARHPEALRLDL